MVFSFAGTHRRIEGDLIGAMEQGLGRSGRRVLAAFGRGGRGWPGTQKFTIDQILLAGRPNCSGDGSTCYYFHSNGSVFGQHRFGRVAHRLPQLSVQRGAAPIHSRSHGSPEVIKAERLVEASA